LATEPLPVGYTWVQPVECIQPGSGQRFKDCPECPEMVAVPAGSFTAGWGGTPHQVKFAEPFAVGQFPVTREEFEAAVKDRGAKMDGGCSSWTGDAYGAGKAGPRDRAKSYRSPGFQQTGAHPVVCVSWNDAAAYVGWLSHKTGKPYRLLSEPELEYAARAAFRKSSIVAANGTGGAEQTSQERGGTLPVAFFKTNPWGFSQSRGNVWEWLQSSQLISVSWDVDPQDVSKSSRHAIHAFKRDSEDRFVDSGFRVARPLTP
jgi:formylglycine-generating enzyme required for sulfatase activity